MSQPVSRHPTVLVAVSPSPSGREALRRGVREARAMGASLRLLRVWRDIDRLLSMTPAEARALHQQQRGEEAILADALARARELDDTLEVETRLLPGDVYDGLLAAAQDVDLVVLGAGDTESRSASIAAWLQRHARCPVAIVDVPLPMHVQR